MTTPRPVKPDVEFKGHGVFNAKERLKQLGGRWDKDRKSWFVPYMHAEEARRQVELGKTTGRLLEPDPNLPALKYTRPRAQSAMRVTCFECGETVTESAAMHDYYCGCVERRQQQAQLTHAKRQPWEDRNY